MKGKYNLCLIIIISVFVCWLVPCSIMAYPIYVDGIYYIINSSTKTAKVTYDEDLGASSYSGDVIIPETFVYNGQTYNVTEIGHFAFCGSDECSDYHELHTGLTSVMIPSSVTSIGMTPFLRCINLASIIVDPNNPKYDSRDNCNAIIETSTNCLIFGCKNTVIPDGVTRIGTDAFAWCTGLTTITIPNSVTEIGADAFRHCTGLTSIDIPNSVTKIEDGDSGVFGYCTGLTSIDIPNSVTSIGNYAFNGCTSLTSVTIPYSVTSIGHDAFYDTPWYNNQSDGLIYINNVAYKYKGEMPTGTSITIRNGTVSISNSAFRGCTGLTTVTIPNSVINIGSYAFYDTPWYNNQPDGLVYAGNVAYQYKGEMPEGTEIVIRNGTVSISDYAFYLRTGLTSIEIPNSMTSIGNFAFSGCTGLTSVTIPNSVTSIGIFAFSNCRGLSSVTIPNSVTSIGSSAFYGCTGLTSITCESETPVTLPNSYVFFNVNKSTCTLYVPYGCKTAYENATYWNEFQNIVERPLSIDGLYYNLDSSEGTATVVGILDKDYSGGITIPESIEYAGNTYSVTGIGNGAFEGCRGLTSVTIPNSVTSIGGEAFNACTSLTSISIPSSVTYIGGLAFNATAWYDSQPDGLIYINNVAYKYKGVIPEGTAIAFRNGTVSISGFGFGPSEGLTSVDIPNSVTTIGSWAFAVCTGLTSVTIPNSVITIDNRAFLACSGLTSVTIGRGVTSIDDSAFAECPSLNSVLVKSETPATLGGDPFEEVNKNTCILYVPKGCKTAYENEYGWRDFRNIVEMEFDTEIDELDNAIYVEQTEGRIGGTKDISVKMKSDYDVCAFQFKMKVPEGVTINSWELSDKRLPSGASTSPEGYISEDGTTVSIACSLSRDYFTGRDGEIVTVRVEFGEDMEEGTYPIYLTNCHSNDFSTIDHPMNDVKASLILEDYLVGDANGDGQILVGDVTALLNYIVGRPSENFNEKAADVNGDGAILVGDVTGLLNIIVSQ